MKRLVLTAVFVLWSHGAASDLIDSFFTGSEILDRCQARGEKRNICSGYVMGLADSHAALVADGLISQPLWCVPVGITTTQLIRETVKYLRAHPEKLQRSSGSLIGNAFISAFPCR